MTSPLPVHPSNGPPVPSTAVRTRSAPLADSCHGRPIRCHPVSRSRVESRRRATRPPQGHEGRITGMKKRIPWRSGLAAAGVVLALAAGPARGASHREAPLMTLDPGADISDVHFFVSYDQDNLNRPPEARKVTMIMNVVPGQEPSSGPNYYAFDDNVVYEVNIDNDRDGLADDIVYQVRFQTELRTPRQFRATLGGGPLPPVTAIDGPGSEGMSRVQRYTVTELRDCRERMKGPKCRQSTVLFGGQLQPTVPSNIGPRTMPMYADLRQQGIRSDASTGIRTFAGQSGETFAIDLGAVFDTVNLRVENATPIPMFRPPLPVQTAAEDANDFVNPFGTNAFSGFNVNSIVLEVPITRLTQDGSPPNMANGTLGLYASTLRQQLTVRDGEPSNVREGKPLLKGAKGFVQVSRMANPLVNELIIRIGRKDFWNATDPADEAQFVGAYQDLDVASALGAVAGQPVPPTPRDDVVNLLLRYAGQNGGRLSELLRLDTTVPPTPPAQIKRLGPFAHDAVGGPTPDPAGFPNGRRPNDDVTDEVVRVAGGSVFIQNFVGDGVGVGELGITPDFPFVPVPYDDRNRRDRDPGEPSSSRFLACPPGEHQSLALRSAESCPSSRLPSGGRGSPLSRSPAWSTRRAGRCAPRARPATRPGTVTRAPRSTGRGRSIRPTFWRCGRWPGCCWASTSSAPRAHSPSRPSHASRTTG